MARSKPTKFQRLVTEALREVHTNEPSTVSRAEVSPTRKEAMRQAIAFDKARDAGAKIPRRKKG
jgi:hypothetical protein